MNFPLAIFYLKNADAILNYGISSKYFAVTSDFDILSSSGFSRDQYEIGLVITTYNRPFYLHRTLLSLSKSDLENTVVLLIDDLSEDPNTNALIYRFRLQNVPTIVVRRKRKKGCRVHEHLALGWEYLKANYQCEYLVNLDSDAIVRPNWLKSLKETLHNVEGECKAALVTGFNAYTKRTVREEGDYCIKETIGGINIFFRASLFEELIQPCLYDLQWDDHVVDVLHEKGYPIVVTRPSVVQHIGRGGLWSGVKSGIFDFAIDYGDVNPFKMKLRLHYYQATKWLGRKVLGFITFLKNNVCRVYYRIFCSRLYANK